MSDHHPSGYSYVETQQALSGLAASLRHYEGPVGVDTEADSLHHYFEKVCLIQVSFSGVNYIVDPLAQIDLSDFLRELAEKELIFQGADFDLRMLKKSYNFFPKKTIFDTMLAAQVLGYEKIGLEALALKHCGVTLSHGGQKSDWSRRPLTQAQLDYASDDTKYLETIAKAQSAEMQKLGREDWHRECCARVVQITGVTVAKEEKEAWRIKGSAKLHPKELAYLRAFWQWRDECARRKDRPLFMILKNDELLQCAQWAAKDILTLLDQGPAYLKRIGGQDRTAFGKAIEEVNHLPSALWPKRQLKDHSRVQGPPQEEVDRLLSLSRSIAQDLKIESSFLASRSAITSLVRHRPQTIEEAEKVSGLMRWQLNLLWKSVNKVLTAQP